VSETHPNRSKSGQVVRSVLRVALVVVATVTVMVLGTLAFKWKELKQAGAPTTKSNALMLQAAVLQLWADGFTGCPTVQQVLELNLEPLKSELKQETNGKDPWGTPYQIQCDQGQVLVFSLGPDKRAGTADDITSVL
jgi:general secretion pathway protein G